MITLMTEQEISLMRDPGQVATCAEMAEVAASGVITAEPDAVADEVNTGLGNQSILLGND